MNRKTLLKNWPAIKRFLQPPLLLVAGLALLFGLAGGFFGSWLFTSHGPLAATLAQKEIAADQDSLWSSIAKNIEPSVVAINVNSTQKSSTLGLLGLNSSVQSQSSGTGIILTSNGIILTNRHVVAGSNGSVQTISVTTNDGRIYNNVRMLATDPRSNFDVAFLQIKGASGLKPAKIGDSSKIVVGDSVLAIGNALGEFNNTVTSGIISGVGRPIVASNQTDTSENLTDLFQTDAAINAGNSGGPLVNREGEVIGLNTAMASNAENIGFSIPVNDLEPEIDSIIRTGKLEVPFLGVSYVMLNDTIKSTYNLATNSGAWLYASGGGSAVVKGSPAAKAGLKSGDIITKIGKQAVNSSNPPSSIIAKYKINNSITITYLRNGQQRITKAVLEQLPGSISF